MSGRVTGLSPRLLRFLHDTMGMSWPRAWMTALIFRRNANQQAHSREAKP